jgi:hypothetical protein
VTGLLEEDLRLGQAAALSFSSAALACSATIEKAAGSLTASSARDLRSSSISALCSPEMNWLYYIPFARAAALMRMIQSWRNVRFLFLRSR